MSSRPLPRSESNGWGEMREADSGAGSDVASSSKCANESAGSAESVCTLNSPKGSEEEEENKDISGEVDAVANMVVESNSKLATRLMHLASSLRCRLGALVLASKLLYSPSTRI